MGDRQNESAPAEGAGLAEIWGIGVDCANETGQTE
jgi:hypothetical protein